MPEDSAVDFGTYLRQARERRGVSLRQIAATTKISVSALEALERNDISRLPGGIFTRAFVRAYAREVGLDPEPTVREFVNRFPHESVVEGSTYLPQTQDDADRERRHSPFRSSLRVAGVFVPVVLAIAYFGLSDRLWKGSPVSAPVTVAERTQPAPQTPSETSPLRQGARANDGASPRSAAPDAGTGTQQGTPREADLLDVAQPASVPDEGGLRLTLSLRGTCWVFVQTDGVQALADLLHQGDEREFRAREEIVLKVGDAGALALAINGMAGRALGAAGAVVTARITPQNYKTYLATQN